METFNFDGLTFEIRKDKHNYRVIICKNTYICYVDNYLGAYKITRKWSVKDIKKAFVNRCKKHNVNASLILEYISNAKKEIVQTNISV